MDPMDKQSFPFQLKHRNQLFIFCEQPQVCRDVNFFDLDWKLRLQAVQVIPFASSQRGQSAFV